MIDAVSERVEAAAIEGLIELIRGEETYRPERVITILEVTDLDELTNLMEAATRLGFAFKCGSVDVVTHGTLEDPEEGYRSFWIEVYREASEI